MENFKDWPLLATISSPADVKALPRTDLPRLAEEIRDYLDHRVSENGGHLASNLGVVELTLAIHRVFDLPDDHLIFDVGHQSYVHKLLTGRKEQFDTLRQSGGISGFTKRSESPYDAFGAGHSSTAVSAALGMAEADRLAGRDCYTVAVIGDGAMTGGLAYEGLNNCPPDLPLIIILNENEMSISPNTGRLSEHLCRIRTSRSYLRFKGTTSKTLRRVPLLGRPLHALISRIKQGMKRVLYRENLFEQMGLYYVGPVDGNNLERVTACLERAKGLGGSVILHVKTVKGKGLPAAEADPNFYHSVPKGAVTVSEKSFSEQFGEAMCALAQEDPRLVAITAAMSCGTGLEGFRQQYPERFFDVGIAEGHAVTFAAGLAAGEIRPVAAIYSTFLQRAFDNIIHDAALQRLPVILAIDRAGLNAGDGPTHHGVMDVAFLSALPGVSIYAPVIGAGIAAALRAALASGKVAAIRYPAGSEEPAILSAFYPAGDADAFPTVRVWESGEAPVLTVVTHGRIAAEALQAAAVLKEQGVALRILLCEYIAPYVDLAKDLIPRLAGPVLFLEEEIRQGGFGMNLADALGQNDCWRERDYRILATENAFVSPAAGQTAREAAGIDAASVAAAALELLKRERRSLC